jgi:hypothetical protein
METKITREVGETFFVFLDRRRPTPLLHWCFAITHGETSGINQAIRPPQTISENCRKKKKKKNTSPLLMCCHLHLFRKQAPLTHICKPVATTAKNFFSRCCWPFAAAISSSKFRLSLLLLLLLLLLEIRCGSVVESGIAIKLITHLAPQLLPSKV